MCRFLFLAAATGAILLINASGAQAQTSGWDGCVRISVNGAEQVTERTIAQSFSVPKNLENAPIEVTLEQKRARLFDVGGTVRLVGGLGVGIAVSALSHDASGSVSGQIPHPFFFNQPRPISGTIAKLSHSETAVHIDGAYIVPTMGKLHLTLFGGVSIFSVTQGLATDVTFTDAYPFDTATFASATTTSVSKTATGFNAGADITWKLSRNVGVGGLVRFAQASVTLAPSAGNSTNTDVGGVQVGGGVRFAF